jgi:Leucine-rich repeat (LRR) protein
MSSNQLTSLDAPILNGLTQLEELDLTKNNFIFIQRDVFKGLLNLQYVFVGSNPISILHPLYVKQLCSTNPRCTIFA